MDRLWLVSNYNQDPTSVIERLDAPFVIYDQGEDEWIPNPLRESGQYIKSMHTGHNISDYLTYIIDNYHCLPKTIGFAKGNLFPRHITKNIFCERQKLHGFVPLYGEEITYKPIRSRFLRILKAQQVGPGYFSERTNNWYVKSRGKGKKYPLIGDLFRSFFDREPPEFITFVPGACMIVPSQNILAWPKETYEKLREAVSYDFFPVEAYHLERCMLHFFCYPKD